ncbi:tyrosine-type recombinase/integrase [Clostridium magnum]|uniref:Tyrosine recombinase XerD n=1 Tax=Clostridium magnum DSM 2767 TaxID=1121326 RepID=A0A162TPL1_9CLOT|nr:tyrosine-type recombinase/integrase [Clostridium magnum]KZL92891.1 tyrosine recombinase XerD [Clostridium magnum DSM 2767]SHI28091.1 integrase/recombinase XerD [Clostridium magnum DSM 2767]
MNILDEFADYLLENEKSKNTISSYKKDIDQFLKWYGGDLNSFSEVNKNALKDFTMYLQNENLSIKTINRRIVSLNQFIKFLNDIFDKGIAVRGKPLKIENQNFIDDMLENSDVIRIVNAAERERDIRAVTIFYTLYYTGARVSEMLQIKVKDISKDSINIKGKGSKYREILIPKKLKDQFKRYLEVRYDTSEYLFSGQRGPINRQTVHNEIKYYTGKARGIDKEIAHAHAFRHLYAQNLAGLGVNPVVISQLLGHSLNVTGLYIQSSKRELLKIINNLELRKTNS